MGLDMYLYRKTHVVRAGKKIIVSEQVAYWRKANAIHKWFVDNCQDGVDDCRLATVRVTQLAELVGVCKQVLAQPELAAQLLPTMEGHFFGSTDYDEGYLDHLRLTVKRLEPLTEDDAYEYHSAWG